MRSATIAAALLATGAIASPNFRRQENNDENAGEKFTNAANDLIENYVPTSVIEAWSAPIMSAASEAQVTGEYTDILYSAIRASSVPGWFESAVPTEFNEQYVALTSGVEELRGAATTAAAEEGDRVSSVTDEAGDRVSSITDEAGDRVSSIEDRVTSKVDDIRSGATSVATRIEDGVTSIISDILPTQTGENAGAKQTAAIGGALMAGLGLVMAL